MLLGFYNYLDLTPKGRNESGPPPPMDWVRRHDRYDGAVIDPKAQYVEPTKTESCCD